MKELRQKMDSGFESVKKGAISAKANGREPVHFSVLRVFQSKEQTRAFYNKISRVYDLLSGRSEAPMRNLGLELLKPAVGDKALEIGCGMGHCLIALAKGVGPNGTVFGLDLSDKMIEQVKQTLAKAELRVRFNLRRGDAARIPRLDNSLDAVFTSFTLELFDTPEIGKFCANVAGCYAPGGRMVVVGTVSRTGNGCAKSFRRFVDGHSARFGRLRRTGFFGYYYSVSR
ncbi:MAG: class I SAM-dependent methyltransferase [Verrucomicrobiota bacterium]